jgi:SPP1 family predicted phage head-tail adaptor
MTVVGRKREFVHVQKPFDRRTIDGDLVVDYDTVGESWLELVPLAGREYWQAQQAQSLATHKGRMRFDGEITSDYRLKIVGTQRYLNIVSAVRGGARGAELVLVLTEVT